MNEKWIDILDNEKELMCLTFNEYCDKKPYFVDKQEIKNIFKEAKLNNINIIVNKINKNRYITTFNNEIIFFICPLSANNRIKQDWFCLKKMFNKYIKK